MNFIDEVICVFHQQEMLIFLFYKHFLNKSQVDPQFALSLIYLSLREDTAARRSSQSEIKKEPTKSQLKIK